MVKAEELLQALVSLSHSKTHRKFRKRVLALSSQAEAVKEYAEEIKKEAEEKKTTRTDDEKNDGAAGFVFLLFLLWGFCGDHGNRRRYNAYDQYY